ncbi:hypothetical protein B0H14DRAFT_3517559 [Mycena olivaceomarginata]|nr:hypothetical protein B0H14DRAFT_3517559 [Mycena olivaceomarginata]
MTLPLRKQKSPPPPVVLLLLQTDLTTHPSAGLMIHEDLERPVPSTKKTVAFAPVLQHKYPPLPNFEVLIPCPTELTRKILEHHAAWEGSPHETAIIKTTVHALVEKLLDTTRSLSDQDSELVQDVYRQAAQVHPDLRRYEDNWVTRCIIQARLKSTSAAASSKATQAVTDLIQTGRRTRSKSKK